MLSCSALRLMFSHSGASQACRHAQDARHSADHPHLRQRQSRALDRLKSLLLFCGLLALTLPLQFIAAYVLTASQAMFCDVTRFELMYKRQLGGYEARYGAGYAPSSSIRIALKRTFAI